MFFVLGVFALAMFLAERGHAQVASPALSSLTPDYSTVPTAVLAIAAVVACVLVVWRGVRWGLAALSADDGDFRDEDGFDRDDYL